MADDTDLQSLIQDAQRAASRPMTITDLKPHERVMVRAIGKIGEQTCLTDDEMIAGMKNVLAYLEISLKRARAARESM